MHTVSWRTRAAGSLESLAAECVAPNSNLRSLMIFGLSGFLSIKAFLFSAPFSRIRRHLVRAIRQTCSFFHYNMTFYYKYSFVFG